MRIVNHGSHHVAHLTDGTAYVVHVNGDDKSPVHADLVALIKGGTVPIETAPPRDPQPVKDYLMMRVDMDASRRIGPPTTEEHRMKLEEARDILDAIDADGDGQHDKTVVAGLNALPPMEIAARYPLLGLSIGIDAPDLVGVAIKVHEQATRVRLRIASFAGIRLRAKQAIRAAKSAEEAESAFAAITWD